MSLNCPQNKLSILRNVAVIITVTTFIPNIILYSVAHYYHFSRPLINVDYFFPAILLLLFNSFLLWSLSFVFVLLIDILFNVAAIFFFKLDDIVIVLQNIRLDILSLYSNMILITLLLIIVFLVLVKLFISIKPSMLGVIIISGIVSLLTFGHFLWPLISNNDVNNFQIVIYPTSRISRLLYKHINMTDSNKKHLEEISSATGELIKSMRLNDPSPDIKGAHLVLIIVESFSLFKIDHLNDIFMEPFQSDSIKKRYDIKIGSVPFYGSTTPAEFRELCGVNMNYIDIKPGAVPKSLPLYLKSLGFKTLAFHGFYKTFYSRYKWYPLIGFDHSYFYKEILKRYHCRQCGIGFRGICDDDIVLLMQQKLLEARKDDRLFLYWVTLNSHLPISEDSASGPGCIYSPRINALPDGTLRLFVKIIYRVMWGVSKMAGNPKVPTTHFILVGDHAPPFISSSNRDLFVNDRVPFIELIPKR